MLKLQGSILAHESSQDLLIWQVSTSLISIISEPQITAGCLGSEEAIVQKEKVKRKKMWTSSNSFSVNSSKEIRLIAFVATFVELIFSVCLDKEESRIFIVTMQA